MSLIAEGFGSRDGYYYPGFQGQMLSYRFSPTAPESISSDLTNNLKSIEGYDHITSALIQMSAPKEARVITPLTTMLRTVDQAKLKVQLGILGQPTSFQYSDPDLLTYDAITRLQSGTPAEQQDAVRMLAFHIQAAVLGYALNYVAMGPNPITDSPNYDLVGATFVGQPNRYLLNEFDVKAMMESRYNTSFNFRADILAAAAHVVTIYLNAVSTDLTASNLPQYTNGVRGFVAGTLENLFRTNTAAVAAEAMALNINDARIQSAKYAPTLPFPTSGRLFASTNYYTLKLSQPLTLQVALISSPLYQQPAYTPDLDDWRINASAPTRARGLKLVSVTVPTANANDIRVVLQSDGTVTITPLNGFRDISYFDYVVALPDGTQPQTGRAFVSVRS